MSAFRHTLGGRLLADPLAVMAVVIIAALIGIAVFANLIAPHDHKAMNIRDCFAAPSAQYWLGTDNLDRDTFSRLLQGGRIALTVALTAVLIAGSIGLVLGMVAGFGPRWLDNGLLFFFDTLHAYPTIMVALTLAALNDRTD